MNMKSPELMTWTPIDCSDFELGDYSDVPIPDHADCFGLPNRYDYSDGMVRFPANGYPGQEGVFGYAVVSACPLCGQWWHWDYKVFTKPGTIVEDE